MLSSARRNHQGSTLIMVMIVFAIVLIFATAVLSLSASSSASSVTDWQSQQAYFTARSAVLASVDYFKKNPAEIEKFAKDVGDSRTGTGTETPEMGEYTVTVKKLDDTHYEISSSADFRGKTRTVSAIIAADGSSGFPFGKNLVTATKFNNKGSNLGGGAEVHGDLMINDTVSIPEGVKVYGDLYIDGLVNISGGPMVKKENGKGGNIYSTGDLTLSSVSAKVDGNLYCKGSLYGNGGGIEMTSSNSSLILVGKNLGGSGFSIQTPKNIVAWGNGDFKNCTIKTINNNVYIDGTNTKYQNDSTFNGISVLKPPSSGYEMPDMSYADAMEELKDLVDLTQYEQYVNTWKGNNINIDGGWKETYTLSQSGTLKSVINFYQTLIVDTSAGDINIYVTKEAQNNNLFNPFNTKVVGENHLILHLAKGVKFDPSSYSSLGITGSATEINQSTKPKICIVAPYEDNAITLSGSAKLAAYIIMPYGDFSASGGSLFVGNAIVASSQLLSGAKLYFQAPDYPTIPGIGEIAVDGDGAGGAAGGGLNLVGVYTNRQSE